MINYLLLKSDQKSAVNTDFQKIIGPVATASKFKQGQHIFIEKSLLKGPPLINATKQFCAKWQGVISYKTMTDENK